MKNLYENHKTTFDLTKLVSIIFYTCVVWSYVNIWELEAHKI